MKFSGHARVQVMVEVPCGVWGPDCTVEQIQKQAELEAVETVERACAASRGRFRIIGKPSVVAVLVPDRKDPEHVEYKTRYVGEPAPPQREPIRTMRKRISAWMKGVGL